ncbi:DUF6597 domain-containing transcriptional factor [Lentzea sp. NPDC051208]|uniref:DUF6597 domain-containing transcriptional factor n=1 Tax=Lentzea sp. NPDC051208 TaxID=3154642 RepID=UPI0034325F2E
MDARELFARVRFRRRMPCSELQPYLEHYWLIDGQLDAPYTSHVVPHPSVNIVFERGFAQPEVAGVGLGLFSRVLDGRIRVAGVQFRPGGFRPFRAEPVSVWTGRHVRLDVPSSLVLDVEDEDERVAALDAFLLGSDPCPMPRRRWRWSWSNGSGTTGRSGGCRTSRGTAAWRCARCSGCSPTTSG